MRGKTHSAVEIIFLGTGTGVPSAGRAAPAVAVRTGGINILVDSGPGTLRQLAKAGLPYSDLDFILYTHFHPDHTAELVPYLFAAKYQLGFSRRNPVRIIGPEGLKKLAGHLAQAYGRWVEPPEEQVSMEEIPVGRSTSFDCGGVSVESGPLPHNPESLGYRLTDPDSGAVLVITGDTDYGPGLVKLARNADLLVTECSFPDGRKVEGHLTPSLAGQAAREAGAKALALNHFYPETEGCDLLSQVRLQFQGPVHLTEDLQIISL